MLLKVTDAAGVLQQVIVSAQEAPVSHSGAIIATGVQQTFIAANLLRSGYYVQNLGANVMYINDLGVAAVGAGSFAIAPNGVFPPQGYPVSTGAISILGTINDAFTAREW